MADFDVRGFDDDGANHNNDFNPTTDEGWFAPDDFPGLKDYFRFYLKHYNSDESAEIGATGTGLFNPFLNMNGDSTLLGFNTNDNIVKAHKDADLDISDPNTDAIQLGDIPIIYRDLDGNGLLEAYYLINLDINENVNTEVSLEELQLFTSSAGATLSQYRFDDGENLAFRNSDGFQLRFDLDANANNKLILRDDGAGQGKLDYTFYFPVELFAGALSSDYLTLFSQFGPNPADDAGFAEWNVLTAAKISGIKFLDRNGDGVRDADGADNNLATTADNESPLAGFTVYIDLNGNNKLDANEQTALTDSNGAFQFASLLPNASYTIREVLTAADVNGPGDAGPDVTFATYAPPAGAWEQTTDPLNDGDQIVNVTTGTTEILVGNKPLTPNFTVSKVATSITNGAGTNGLDGANSAGDIVNYTITIDNTGDVNLTGFAYTDANADGDVISYVSGDDGDGVLETNETWIYSAAHTVTQAEMDSGGTADTGALDTDDDTDNKVTVSFDQIGPKSASAATPILQNPDFSVTKVATSITNGAGTNGLDGANSAGDIVNYTITIDNTGNVSLTGFTYTDANADGDVITYVSGDDGDGNLEVNETWIYSAAHTVTQAEMDSGGTADTGALDSDDDTDNKVTVSFTEAGPKSATASTPILQNPDFSVTKVVSGIDGGINDGGILKADTAGDIVNYTITIDNTGNLTLTGFSYTDANADGDVITYVSGDDGDGNLEVNETWIYSAAHTVTQAELDGKGTGITGAIDGDGDTDNRVTVQFTEAGPKNADATSPLVYNPDFSVTKVATSITGGAGTNGLDGANSANDVVNYTITIDNTGNVSLTGFSYTDANADGDVITYVSGDDGDGNLEVNETWIYSAAHTVTQAEIDSGGTDDTGALDSDDDTDNKVTISFTEAGPKSASAATPILQSADFSVTKVATSITGGAGTNGLDGANSANDVVNYTITIDNTGNLTLTGFTYTDANADGDVITYVSGDDGDGDLEVNETWIYSAAHTVTQAEMDSGGTADTGALDADDDTDNKVTVSFNEAGPKSATAVTPILQNANVDLFKYVDVGFGWDDANAGPDPLNVNVGGDVDFKITIENTGNVTLTAVDVNDTYLSGGPPGTANLLVDDGALTAYALAHNAVLTGDDNDGNSGNGLVADGILQVGETWTITYTEPFDPLSFAPGAHLNTADVTTAEGATDEDSAYYYSLISVEGPGVRTPGFWQNAKNGGQFWDGVTGNAKHDGEVCFPTDDLLRKDSDGDGDIDGNDSGYTTYNGVLGLFIGDYDRSGTADSDEDVIFISRANAMALLSSNTKDMNDMAVKIGRDAVATWLNYLAGNEIGEDPDASLYSPKEAINDAIDYLQTYAGVNNGGSSEIWDVYKPSHTAVTNKANAAAFAAGAPIHNALDEYNNFGTINGQVWAHDCDDQAFVTALTIYQTAHPDLF